MFHYAFSERTVSHSVTESSEFSMTGKLLWYKKYEVFYYYHGFFAVVVVVVVVLETL